MTLHNNFPSHRQLKERQQAGRAPQIPAPPALADPTGEETPPPESTPGPDPTETHSSVSSNTKPTQTSTPPPAKPTQQTTKSAPQTTPPPTPTPTPPSSTQEQQTTVTSTSSSQAESSSESQSSTTSTTSVTSALPTTANLGPVTITGPPVIRTQTSSFSTFTATTDLDASPSISPSQSAAPSSGISTGAIVGSVAGGIAGIALIGIIIAFFLRRWRRNRISDDDFNTDDFVRASPDSPYRASTFDPVPPNMSHRGGHHATPSIGGPNMAGHGAFAAGAGAAGMAVGVGATIQERQMYTYGQNYDDTASDHAHGAYSSEPQMQATYNPEAYGSYAYSTEGHYAAATTAPGQAFHPYSAQEYQAHYQDNASTQPQQQYYNNGPPPALVAGAPAVPAGRAVSIIDTEDAYGGI
ncbi:hypothetical protein DXG03_004639 [Asterophora parasitica]|uniref:Uncharacterized protein n=1 Tax=Asterophora parasitica TaxID=117018 RepID=A0A9P7G284_9AGAR|nr:hypothetical protein DXG03_004639 [Asterophora parasitica]